MADVLCKIGLNRCFSPNNRNKKPNTGVIRSVEALCTTTAITRWKNMKMPQKKIVTTREVQEVQY